MVSLKQIVYYTDDATFEKNTHISIKDLCLYFHDEGLDDNIVYRRIASQIAAYRNMFCIKKEKRRIFFRLSANGYRYLNKFRDTFDPVTDKMLIDTNKHKQIFKPIEEVI